MSVLLRHWNKKFLNWVLKGHVGVSLLLVGIFARNNWKLWTLLQKVACVRYQTLVDAVIRQLLNLDVTYTSITTPSSQKKSVMEFRLQQNQTKHFRHGKKLEKWQMDLFLLRSDKIMKVWKPKGRLRFRLNQDQWVEFTPFLRLFCQKSSCRNQKACCTWESSCYFYAKQLGGFHDKL